MASGQKITIGVSPLEWKTLRLVARDLFTPAQVNTTDAVHVEAENLVCALNRLQSWLDNTPEQIQAALSITPQGIAQFYRRIRRVILRLATSSNQLPNSLFVVLDNMLREPFGGGAYADVFRGMFRGEPVASKRLRIFEIEDSRDKIHARFCREVVLWRPLVHENILPFLGVYVDPLTERWCMISPWMRNGNMVEFIAKARYTSGDLQRLLVEIARGLTYLHDKSVVHGDLRGANVLIDEAQHARLADFGLAVMLSTTATMGSSSGAGSARWMAPELHNAGDDDHSSFQRTPASDVYSFASVCLEAYTRRAPFAEISNDITAVLRILQGKFPRRPCPDPDTRRPSLSIPDHLWNLMTSCWHTNPTCRPSTKHLEPTIHGMSLPLQPTMFTNANEFELVSMAMKVPIPVQQKKPFESFTSFLASQNNDGPKNKQEVHTRTWDLVEVAATPVAATPVAELQRDLVFRAMQDSHCTLL